MRSELVGGTFLMALVLSVVTLVGCLYAIIWLEPATTLLGKIALTAGLTILTSLLGIGAVIAWEDVN